MSNGSTSTTTESNSAISRPNIGLGTINELEGVIRSQFRDAEAQSGTGRTQVENDARNLVGETLRGSFLDPSTNPHLQRTFDIGADAITNRLNTNFARSGRDLAAGRPAAADELGRFAADLFGSNFQAERDRQVAAVGQEAATNPLNQAIERLRGIIPISGTNIQGTNNSQTEDKASPFDRLLGGIGVLGRVMGG